MAAVIFSPPRHWKKRGGLLLAFANGTLKGLFLIIIGRASPYLIVLRGMKRCGQGEKEDGGGQQGQRQLLSGFICTSCIRMRVWVQQASEQRKRTQGIR